MSQVTDPAVLSRLLPCPFCGATATAWLDDDGDYVHGDVSVCCPDQACEAQVWGKDAADAIARWNKRAPLTAAVVPSCWVDVADPPTTLTVSLSGSGRWPLIWANAYGNLRIGDKVFAL